MARRAGTGGSPPGPLRLRSELLRTLALLDREVEAGLAPPGLEPDEVHSIHRDLRRLSSGLTVWSRLISPSDATQAIEVARRTRRLARLVGRVRDRDVTTSLLAPAARRPSNGTAAVWSGFLGQLREDTHIQRELLRAFLRTERQAGLLERSRGLLALAPRADANRGLARILAEERRTRQRRVRRAHRRAVRRPTSERLHRLRIRIRQWRHLSALEVAVRATNHPPPPSWRTLQERLGQLHDLDVALASIPGELADSAPARHLRDARKELRRAVRGTLDRIVLLPARSVGGVRRRART